MKIGIIGAGNVGAMVASRVIDTGLADVVLVDIVPGLAKAKAMDISDARPIFNSQARITGTADYAKLKGADIVVITAGQARKPGMSRDELSRNNIRILKSIVGYIKNLCSHSIVIVVTNPLDAMTYLTMRLTGFEPRRIMGMAGVLDSARFINILSDKMDGRIDKDKILMLGSHGDTMVAVNRIEHLPENLFETCSEKARQRGTEIVSLLKTGSAYFAPSAAVFSMLRAIVKDEKRTMCVSAYLKGEYGEKDIYIGVPAVLDSSGVREVVEIELTKEESQAFARSAQTIRRTIAKISCAVKREGILL